MPGYGAGNPLLLGQHRERFPVRRGFQPIEEHAEIRMCRQPRHRHDDREPEHHLQPDEAELIAPAGQRVGNPRADAVARPPFGEGMIAVRVKAAGQEAGVIGGEAAPGHRLAVCRGHGVRIIIEIAMPIRPGDVVADRHGRRRRHGPVRAVERLDLVKDGIPIMVAVDQHEVRRQQIRQNVEAERGMDPDMAVKIG